MKFVASLVVDRVVGDSKVEPLWPDGVNRQMLVVSSADDGSGTLIAHGIDPALSCVMFQTRELRVDQLSGFIKAMVDGNTAVLADGVIAVALAAANGNAGGDVVVIPNVPPKHVGPKLMAALAEATAANLDLAMPDALPEVDEDDSDVGGGSAMAFRAAAPPA
jgi:hypothetical protein